MWTTEHSIEATGSPEAIWRVWADVPSWGEWNPDIERVDRADLGDVVVRTVHHAEKLEGGPVRVTYRMEISGPAADTLGHEFGPAISADFPEVLAALVERAQR